MGNELYIFYKYAMFGKLGKSLGAMRKIPMGAAALPKSRSTTPTLQPLKRSSRIGGPAQPIKPVLSKAQNLSKKVNTATPKIQGPVSGRGTAAGVPMLRQQQANKLKQVRNKPPLQPTVQKTAPTAAPKRTWGDRAEKVMNNMLMMNMMSSMIQPMAGGLFNPGGMQGGAY